MAKRTRLSNTLRVCIESLTSVNVMKFVSIICICKYIGFCLWFKYGYGGYERYANCHLYLIFTATSWQLVDDSVSMCVDLISVRCCFTWDTIVYGDGHSAVRVTLVVTFGDLSPFVCVYVCVHDRIISGSKIIFHGRKKLFFSRSCNGYVVQFGTILTLLFGFSFTQNIGTSFVPFS